MVKKISGIYIIPTFGGRILSIKPTFGGIISSSNSFNYLAAIGIVILWVLTALFVA